MVRGVTTPVCTPVACTGEDLAELAVQCALRLSRTYEEGAPRVRVLRVAPDKSNGATAERPVQTYDSVIAGPKFRAAQGTVQSGAWSELLAPFGVVKASDPDDWRRLVSVSLPPPGTEPWDEPPTTGGTAVAAEELSLQMDKESRDAKFGIAMTGGADIGVVVTRVMPYSPAEDCGLMVSDTILSINGAAVQLAAEATRLLKEAPTGTVVLQVARGRDAAAWVVKG